MFEPIIEKGHRENLYLKAYQMEVVKGFSKNPSRFKEKYDFPLRHYSQIAVELDPKVIQNILKKLSINTTNKVVSIFGGFTGQFAECLRDMGFRVIFTDPIEEYVSQAKKKGFESYCFSVEELPSNIIKKSDLFATFECYMPFIESSRSMYTTLRLLSAPKGFIFAESKRTREELNKEGGKSLSQLKHALKPFADNYSIKRIFRENEGIRIYHFFKEKTHTDNIGIDCKIIKLLYDYSNTETETKINTPLINRISKVSRIPKKKIIQSIYRISRVHYGLIPKSFQSYFPSNEFRIFSKNFIYES